jgi:hypothetical protein
LKPLLDIAEIVRQQAAWTAQWHDATTPPRTGAPWPAIEQNHRMNFDLWHEEDIARRDDLGSDRIREAKRVIDRCNQTRNDAVEQIDVWLLSQLPPANLASPQHSETPGMIIDRLSILSLKLYHMRIEAARETVSEEHRTKCRNKALILEEQTRDLEKSMADLLAAFGNGSRHFKLYRQFKMYNDASLNPQLYGTK